MDLLKPADDVKGKVTMMSTDRWLMAAGLKALGYSVNATDAAEIDAARDLLIEATKHLVAYDDTTLYSTLVYGEANLVQARDDREGAGDGKRRTGTDIVGGGS